MNTPSLSLRRLVVACAIAASFAYTASLTAQIPARNVNMVSGTVWPGGDPFLQRQNEPSIAASTRNPLHLLAGSNDYRSMDLAGMSRQRGSRRRVAGLFMSTDGGERWTSTLVPGFPHDPDPRGQASPLYGYQAAADPVVRAGTNGLMYFAGLAFDRTTTGFGKSAHLRRALHRQQQPGSRPSVRIHQHLDGRAQTAASGVFLDKPWMAVDIPRQGAGTCNITTVNEHGPFTQQLPAGNVYVAFTVKSADAQGDRWDLYFSRSTNCGVHFSTPTRISRPQDRVNQGASIVISPTTGAVYISWRRIDLNPTDGLEEHAIVVARSVDQGKQVQQSRRGAPVPARQEEGPQPDRASPATASRTASRPPRSSSWRRSISPRRTSTSSSAPMPIRRWPRTARGRLYLAWTERGFATTSAAIPPTATRAS